MMILLSFVVWIAGALAFDWAGFVRFVGGFPPTSSTAAAYRDYFFPRAIFIALAGASMAYGAWMTGEPGGSLFIIVGGALFLIAHCIQYYWFLTD